MSACAGKARCRSRWEATKLLAKVTAKGLGPQRAYRCKRCGGWHLTSRVPAMGYNGTRQLQADPSTSKDLGLGEDNKP
jgi:hypothetical protein